MNKNVFIDLIIFLTLIILVSFFISQIKAGVLKAQM